LTTPLPLKPGDTIALVATARKVTPGEMRPAIDRIGEWGYRVREGANLYKQDHQFAGSDAERLADLQQALDDPAVKAVLFARGGYGTARIVDGVNLAGFTQHPKWLIGFSDVTVLHSHVHRYAQTCTLHAPMAINFGKAPAPVLDALLALLKGERPGITFDNSSLNRPGHATGTLVGGNLSILYSLACTPSDIDTKGKILFLEDLDEHLYHVDRMMVQLKRSGKLRHLAGLVVGDVGEMRDNTKKWGFAADNPYGHTAAEIIHEHVAGYEYPVAFGCPAGHRSDNRPLLFGAVAELQAGDPCTLTYPDHG
jgi:muramoyltetrapeptide carboxypeptidase